MGRLESAMRSTIPFAFVLLASLLPLPASAQHARRIVWLWEPVRCTAPASELAELMQGCVLGVMFPRGHAGPEVPEVDATLAALACRNIRTLEMSRSLSVCVRTLMYERSGLGARRELISAGEAVTACRYATSDDGVEHVESCMLRLLYTREGLGNGRTELTASNAALACQGVAVSPALPWPFLATCGPPRGEEAVRFVDECVKRLLFKRDGHGTRRREVPPDAAVLACEGVLAAWR
jgi:hypothetical protein